MFEALNRERLRQGLMPVAWSTELARAAALHSEDMARADFLDHDGSDGSDPQQRAARAGYLVPANSGWMVIEAISAMPSMEAALDWLLTDGLHRRVLLRETWREVGIGYASGGRYGNYWTLDFGCRPNVLPVFATPISDGQALDLTFTNEHCAAYGGGPDQMGRATSYMLSARSDFRGAEWQPYVASQQLPGLDGSDLNVRFKDDSGRVSTPFRLVFDFGASGSSTTSRTEAKSPTATPTPRPGKKSRSSNDNDSNDNDSNENGSNRTPAGPASVDPSFIPPLVAPDGQPQP